MVQLFDVLIGVLGVFVGLSIWRWLWIREERGKIVVNQPSDDDARFVRQGGDEDDQTHAGRVIKRLRSHVSSGQISINWQYHPEYIHRGFVLTGQYRRNQGPWEPLGIEPHEDSGHWNECFNYGESRSYMFTVKKKYHFFFGLLSEDETEVVYDQISFAVRNGVALKEKKEYFHDRKELAVEIGECYKAESTLERMARSAGQERPAIEQRDPRVARLQERYQKEAEMADFIEAKTAEIRARTDWTDERKDREIERLTQLAEESALED